MAISRTTKKHLASVAEPTLEALERISATAQVMRTGDHAPVEESFAKINTFTQTAAVQNLSKIRRGNDESPEQLYREPAIARVVATDSHGDSRVYYICRATPVRSPVATSNGEISLASYRSPVGRLVSLPFGDDVELPSLDMLTVVEHPLLRPLLDEAGWDSRHTVMQGDEWLSLCAEYRENGPRESLEGK